MTASGRARSALGAAALGLLAVGLLAAGLLPVPVAVLSVPFVVLAARKPVLRRLAVRNASRRPRETALVLLGALLGTAIITGSAIVGDTLGSSIRRSAHTQLGPVDEVIDVTSAPDPAGVVTAVRALPPSEVDGVLTVTSARATVATTGDDIEAEPHALVIETDFAAARAFGGDAHATGIEGATPGEGSAAIGADLARTLEVGTGDTVAVYAYGAQRTFTIDRVLPRRGVAGLQFGRSSLSPNLFVAPGTLGVLAAAAPAGAAPPQTDVLVSNAGGVIDGADRSSRVARLIDEAVAAPITVEQAKSRLLRDADEQGRQFTELFTSIGFFSVIAGILLLVAIFVMLAEERKTELGMLRAVGLRRAALVGTFALEGWLYSLGAAALGTIAGIGVGRAIVLVTARIFARGQGGYGLELHYSAHLATVQRGFVIGFVMSILTVLATSLWISRLNVIRAIRDLPEPPRERRSILLYGASGLAIGIGVMMTIGGLRRGDGGPIMIGPALAALGAAFVLRRVVPRRVANTVASGGVLVWNVTCFSVAGDAFRNPPISLFVVNGVLLTVSAVALVSQHQALIGRVLRRAGGGNRNMAMRLGLAHPLERAFRTSVILMTFALVMFTLVAMTLFSSVFSAQIDRFAADVSGGFSIRAASNPSNPVDPAAVDEQAGVAAVAPLIGQGAQFQGGKSPGEYRWWGVAGYDERFVDVGPPSLGSWLPQFADADAVWRGVLADPSLLIVDDFFLQSRGGPPQGAVEPGQKVRMLDPATSAEREMTIAAVLDTAAFGDSPVYMSGPGMREFFGPRAVPSMLLIATDPGADAQAVAERLNGTFLANGMDAISFRSLVAQGVGMQQSFLRLMQGYLALGLVVGVAGLGVVMVRAVRERRREVGVLRALGFDATQVRRAFLTESAFVAVEGILCGTVLAVISTWRLIGSGAFGEDLAFAVPWGQVAVVVALAFVATLVATATPAQQASRIRPAVALRIAD